MRQRHLLFAMFAVAVLLLGMTGCGMTGNPVSDDPDPVDVSALEKELVGLWWDEYEYADVTETGVPFTRVLLAVKADADHTGCIYLGVFNGKSDVPLAVYGGPEDAGFTWKLLADGRILLGDPVTGETYALSRTRGGDGSYGDGMTDVSGTTLTYTDGSVTATNANYSGTLTKADPEQQAEIEEQLAVKATDTPLTVEALTDGTVKVDIERASGPLSTGMKYAVNGGEKTLITTSTDIPVSAGDKVQFYGNGTATQVYGNYPKVIIEGNGEGFTCKAYGNVMSLLDEEGYATKTDLPNESYVFSSLFSNNTALTDAGGLLLPATTLSERCYEGMFSLCTALTAAPALPAETLAEFCYFGMFRGCTALTAAPALPATTLVRGCYAEMFQGCTALKTAPDLHATTLVDACYLRMFNNCTSLNSVKCLATSGIAEDSSTYEWLVGLAATGTFYLASESGIKWLYGGISGVPFGWTGKYPDGSTWCPTHPLTQATVYDVGMLVGADGYIYESPDAIARAGVTPVAMVACVTKKKASDPYLAIALHNEGYMVWDDAWKAIREKPEVSGGTWRLPSIDHWKAMFQATSGNENNYAALEKALVKVGGTGFLRKLYWTDTQHWDYDFLKYTMGTWYSNEWASFNWYDTDLSHYVRAVLLF